MRHVYILLLSLATTQVFTQPQFEGKIIYSVVSHSEKKIMAITVSFASEGIRLEAFDSSKQKMEDEVIIIRFDSGKVFTLMPSAKTYRMASLLKFEKHSLPQESTIAGYTVKPFRYESSGLKEVTGAFFGEPLLQVADDLYYFIPEVYLGNPQLLMVRKNRIVLAIEVPLAKNNTQWNLNNTIEEKNDNRHMINGKAMTVKSEKLDSSLFTIPANYEYKSYFSSEYPVDSVSVMVDSMNMIPQKPSIKKKKQTPLKKKSTTKQNAIGRKDN